MLIETQRSEGRNEFVISEGAISVCFEVIHQFEDTLFDKTLVCRRVVSVSVEGDIPITLKNALADCIERRRYTEADRWVQAYLRMLSLHARNKATL